jgi:transcriptional regulator with XRE-family HTH domain
MLRASRKRMGWSQTELSRRSGYSERVIRKAEAGGQLRFDTIQHFAQALSQAGEAVNTEMLIYDPVSIAASFIEAYDQYGHGMLQHAKLKLHESFEYHVPADPELLTFAGTWRGADGLRQFLDFFFAEFTREPNSLQPVYLQCPNRVVACYEESLTYRDEALPKLWVNLHFVFKDNSIERIDNQFDFLLCAQSIGKFRSRLNA